MPCRDYEPGEVVYRDNPEIVAMLCHCCRFIEANGEQVPGPVRNWWNAHKREDAIRREAEKERLSRDAKRKKILEKLSDEDKRILGLK